MLDQHGRKIDYIRISVTDRCNLRCVYCMPPKGVRQIKHEEILTFKELISIVRLCAAHGISKVKLTGGEPLVRRGIADLAEAIKNIDGISQLTLTTNGILLAENMQSLADAGLDAVNISLDTLDETMYEQITGRRELTKALAGIQKALEYPGIRVKINCVPLEGINDSQLILLAGLAESCRLDVRFIEMMPIGLGKNYIGKMQDEIVGLLRRKYGQETVLNGQYGNGPGVYIQFKGFQGRIGFISAMSHKFCEGCNRIRLTAEGVLKPCLQYAGGLDLRTPIRAGAEKEELNYLIESAIYRKPLGHQFGLHSGIGLEEKQMYRIGG